MSKNSEQNFDARWDLPEKFRVTPEMTPRMRRIVKESDAQQKEWLDANAFEQATPQTRERMRATEICRRFEAQCGDGKSTNSKKRRAALPDAQKSEWATACAALGRFDQAAQIAPSEAEFIDYAEIWQAVLRDEDEFCPHPQNHHFAERDVYSVKLNQDAVLMRCNVCLFRNVVPMPDFLRDDRSKRAVHRARYSGTNPQEISK